MKTILAIEDNPDNMALIKDILEDEEGFRLLEAVDAEQGMKILKNTSVDLILMDVSLPTMNGLEATNEIKKRSDLRHIPVIVVTALAMKSDREAAFSAGCDAFLTKPLDEELLVNTIRSLLTKCVPA